MLISLIRTITRKILNYSQSFDKFVKFALAPAGPRANSYIIAVFFNLVLVDD